MPSTIGKEEKLKGKKTIEQLFEEGKRIRSFPLQMVYLKKEHGGEYPFKVGFSVPKRLIKKAVNRNRIRRLMKEAYRTSKKSFIDSDSDKHVVMFVYITTEERASETIRLAIENLADKFKNKTQNHEQD